MSFINLSDAGASTMSIHTTHSEINFDSNCTFAKSKSTQSSQYCSTLYHPRLLEIIMVSWMASPAWYEDFIIFKGAMPST